LRANAYQKVLSTSVTVCVADDGGHDRHLADVALLRHHGETVDGPPSRCEGVVASRRRRRRRRYLRSYQGQQGRHYTHTKVRVSVRITAPQRISLRERRGITRHMHHRWGSRRDVARLICHSRQRIMRASQTRDEARCCDSGVAAQSSEPHIHLCKIVCSSQ
jgi:hypothetical protein